MKKAVIALIAVSSVLIGCGPDAGNTGDQGRNQSMDDNRGRSMDNLSNPPMGTTSRNNTPGDTPKANEDGSPATSTDVRTSTTIDRDNSGR